MTRGVLHFSEVRRKFAQQSSPSSSIIVYFQRQWILSTSDTRKHKVSLALYWMIWILGSARRCEIQNTVKLIVGHGLKNTAHSESHRCSWVGASLLLLHYIIYTLLSFIPLIIAYSTINLDASDHVHSIFVDIPNYICTSGSTEL